MIRICYVLFFLAAFNMSSAQVTTNIQWTTETALPAKDVIYYSNNSKLNWADFQGAPQERGIVAAVTYSGFGYKADIQTVGGKSQLNIKVYCYFNKDKSWVKEGKTTDYILAHEQHHFDISFIAASIFIDRLQGTAFTQKDFNTLLPRIYRECVDVMDKMQNEYDSQTKNGQLKDKQELWNNKINSMVRQFSAR